MPPREAYNRGTAFIINCGSIACARSIVDDEIAVPTRHEEYESNQETVGFLPHALVDMHWLTAGELPRPQFVSCCWLVAEERFTSDPVHVGRMSRRLIFFPRRRKCWRRRETSLPIAGAHNQ